MYNWQHIDWPNFTWDAASILPALESYVAGATTLLNSVNKLPHADLQQYLLDRLVEEAASTSSIEGEIISRQELMSSLLNNLNRGADAGAINDLRARAIGQQMVLNQETFTRPVTETALKYWHELLLGFDDRLSVVGDYRKSSKPMQIISGPPYRATVHFQAPPSTRVPALMPYLIEYCNAPAAEAITAVIRAGVAHLWFESIHPFEDGNGRIGRALTEKLLSQQLGVFVPFSLSQAIAARRSDYYRALRQSSKHLDITPWLHYYGEVLLQAVSHATKMIAFTVEKHRYFHQFDDQLDDPQLKAVRKMWEAGPAGFQGGMTARKYAHINRVSRATATRALQHLQSIGALTQHGAGRSTHYRLPPTP